MSNQAEDALYKQVAVMMRVCYPTVIYRFDFGAGAFLSDNFRLMNLQKAIQMPEWKHPDLTIYQFAIDTEGNQYSGCCLELKPDGAKLFKKDGITYATDHLRAQADALMRLKEKGYFASFAVGIKQVQRIVDEYLLWSGEKKKGSLKF